jgi:uncharacterized protein (TIGR02996 family)
MKQRAENQELERRILDAPDDEQNYLAYGAWLRSQGDVRGEARRAPRFRTSASSATERSA